MKLGEGVKSVFGEKEKTNIIIWQNIMMCCIIRNYVRDYKEGKERVAWQHIIPHPTVITKPLSVRALEVR